MIPGLVVLRRILIACGLLGALMSSWLVYDAVAPPRAVLRCDDLTPSLEEGRYRLVETCEEHYDVSILAGRGHGAFSTYSLHTPPTSPRERHVVRFRTAYPPARRARRSAQRSSLQAMRYAERHGEDLWPVARALDMRRVPFDTSDSGQSDLPTLYFEDPPLALRVETVLSLLLTLCCLLGLLFIRHLRLRWTPRPRLF